MSMKWGVKAKLPLCTKPEIDTMQQAQQGALIPWQALVQIAWD